MARSLFDVLRDFGVDQPVPDRGERLFRLSAVDVLDRDLVDLERATVAAVSGELAVDGARQERPPDIVAPAVLIGFRIEDVGDRTEIEPVRLDLLDRLSRSSRRSAPASAR